jgi:hypothetical protein
MRRSSSANVNTLPRCYSSPKKSDGHRQLFETGCQAPEYVSDRQLLSALAAEMYEDFAISGVVKFCVAYLARRVTVIKPLDPKSSMRPSTTKRRGVVIELHSAEAQARIFREIVHSGGKSLLGAPESSMSRSPPALISTCCRGPSPPAQMLVWPQCISQPAGVQ